MSETKKPATALLLGTKEHPVRFSYAKVLEPELVEMEQEDGTVKKVKRWSVSVVISKNDIAGIAAVEDAVEAAKLAGKTSKWGGKVPGNLKMPLRDGDVDRPDDPAYANAMFINANCYDEPGVVDRIKIDGKFRKLTTENEFYSGCYGRVSLTFYPFNKKGNKGVGAGLGNIQKIKDGERLSGRTSADDDFDEVDDEDDLMG